MNEFSNASNIRSMNSLNAKVAMSQTDLSGNQGNGGIFDSELIVLHYELLSERAKLKK